MTRQRAFLWARKKTPTTTRFTVCDSLSTHLTSPAVQTGSVPYMPWSYTHTHSRIPWDVLLISAAESEEGSRMFASCFSLKPPKAESQKTNTFIQQEATPRCVRHFVQAVDSNLRLPTVWKWRKRRRRWFTLRHKTKLIFTQIWKIQAFT